LRTESAEFNSDLKTATRGESHRGGRTFAAHMA